MQQIYTEEDILSIIDKYSLYYCRISDYMYVIGLNSKYLIGNISIISNELVCEIHFNAGRFRIFRKYKYDEKRFAEDVKLAASGLLEKENYKVDKILDNLLK